MKNKYKLKESQKKESVIQDVSNVSGLQSVDTVQNIQTMQLPGLREKDGSLSHLPEIKGDLMEQMKIMMLQSQAFLEMQMMYSCAIREVRTKAEVLNDEMSVRYHRNPISSITSRVKKPESIIQKLHKKGLPFTVEAVMANLSDVAGVRIICEFVDDIYVLAECLLQQDDIRLIERKDYIKDPKINGYRSLHLIVEIPIFLQNEKRLMKVEVQLRTIAMEFWANLEHKLRYKKSIPEDTVLITSAELSQCAEMSALLDKKMQKIRDLIENS